MTRRTFRIAFEILAGLVAGMAIIIGVGVWRLSSGPIDLSFLTPYVEEAINSEGSPVRVKIQDTVLTWGGWERAVDIVARNVDVAPVDAADRPVAKLPEVSFNLSLRALAQGIVAPTTLEILNPRIALRRLPSGSFGLSIPQVDDTEMEVAEEAVTPLDRVLADIESFTRPPVRDHVLGYLTRISIVDAEATFRDYHSGRNWAVGDGVFDLTRDEEGVELVLTGQINQGRHFGDVRVSIAKPFEAETAVVVIESEQTRVGLLEGIIPTLNAGAVADDLLAFRAEAAIRDDGTPLNWTVTASSDSLGDIVSDGLMTDSDNRAFQATLDITDLDPAIWAALLPDLDVAEAVDGALSAKATLAGRFDTGLSNIRLDNGSLAVTGEPGRLNLSDLYPQPIDHNGFSVEAAFNDGFDRAELSRVTLDLPEGFIEAQGTTSLEQGGRQIALQGKVSSFDMAHLSKLWPPGLGEDARDWVVENITEGPVSEATINLAATIDGEGNFLLQDMGGEIALTDAVVHYFRPLPPATGVSGTATYGPDWFDIDMTGGAVGNVKIEGGKIKIADIASESNNDNIDITLQLDAPFREALDLVDHEPLNLVSGIGFDKNTVAGHARGTARFRFPLLLSLKADDVRVEVDASLTDLTMQQAFKDLPARGEELKMKVTNDGFSVVGEVVVAGVPLVASWQENFSSGVALRKRLSVNGVINETELAGIGYNLIPYLDGDVDLAVESREFRDGRSEIDLSAELTNAGLVAPPLDWMKPRTFPARLNLSAKWKEGEPVNIVPVEFTSDTLSVRGSASLARDQETIRQVLVDRMLLNGADITGSAVRQEDGGYVVDIRGEYVDISGILDMLDSGDDALDNGPPEEPGTPFVVNTRFGIVTAGPQRRLLDTRFSMQHDGAHLQFLTIEALAKDGSPINIRYGLGAQGYELVGSMENASSALRSVHGYDGIDGGRMTIHGTRSTQDAPLTGRIEMKDFVLIKAPAMAKVLEFMSLTGTLNALTSEGLPFSNLQADYSLDDQELTLHKAKVFGASVGISLSGVYDLKHDRIEAKGTVVPAYAINRAIGAIPLVGWILTGGEDGGFFGANYAVSGPLDNPEVTVNPLSALTPGVLRKLFDIFPNQPADGEEGTDEPQVPGARIPDK